MDEDIALRGASAEAARSSAAMTQRQLAELRETWHDRRLAPGLQNALSRLEQAYKSGTLDERIEIQKLAVQIQRHKERFEGSKSDIVGAVRDIFLPWLQSSAEGSERLRFVYRAIVEALDDIESGAVSYPLLPFSPPPKRT